MPSTRSWPRCKLFRGFAFDWPGAAWLALVTGEAAPAMCRGIVHRLRAPLARSTSGGLFAGQAVLPLLGLLAGAPPSLARRLVERWRRAPLPSVDYVDGAAGAVIAWVEIAAATPELVDLGTVRKLHAAVRGELRAVTRSPAGAQLGLAHGIAGLLLAAELGAAAFGLALPTSERQGIVDVLAAAAVELPGAPRAIAWPSQVGDRVLGMHAWCHGAPGIALALAHAWRASRQAVYGELATLALAATARQLHRREAQIFCCGLAGRIQVLVEGYRVFGDPAWLSGACELARKLRAPVPRSRHRRSFLRGAPGLAYAQLRVRDPDRLPLFGVGNTFAPNA